MAEHEAKPAPRWNVQPLQQMDGENAPTFHVPELPQRVILAPTDGDAAVYVPEVQLVASRERERALIEAGDALRDDLQLQIDAGADAYIGVVEAWNRTAHPVEIIHDGQDGFPPGK